MTSAMEKAATMTMKPEDRSRDIMMKPSNRSNETMMMVEHLSDYLDLRNKHGFIFRYGGDYRSVEVGIYNNIGRKTFAAKKFPDFRTPNMVEEDENGFLIESHMVNGGNSIVITQYERDHTIYIPKEFRNKFLSQLRSERTYFNTFHGSGKWYVYRVPEEIVEFMPR